MVCLTANLIFTRLLSRDVARFTENRSNDVRSRSNSKDVTSAEGTCLDTRGEGEV